MMLTTASLPQYDQDVASVPPLALARPGLVALLVNFQNKLSGHSRAVTVAGATGRVEVTAAESWSGGALADAVAATAQYDGSATFTFTQSNKHAVATTVDLGGPGTFIGAAQNAATAANVTATLPAGWAPGDLAVVGFTGNESLTWQPADPAGWTLIADAWTTGSLAAAQRVYARVLQAGDVSVTYGLTSSGNLSVVLGVWRIDPPPAEFTATPDPETASVRLDLAALPTPVYVTRSAGGAAPVPVRDAGPLAAGAVEVSDREAPFGVPLVYTATYGPSGEVVTASARLDVDRPRLEHPGLASLGMWVDIVDDTPPEWVGASVVHEVIGRTFPLATGQPMRARAGVLALAVAGPTEVDRVRTVFSAGLPVLLRVTRRDRFRDGWLTALRVRDAHRSGLSASRVLEVEYAETARPLGPSRSTPGWTVAAVAAAYGTVAEVREAYSTVAGLAAGPVPVP